ncbi:MAG: altronate dehydratase [Firmicutes bacterium]|nr:altronate dehydratase [Bacillota bacterium]
MGDQRSKIIKIRGTDNVAVALEALCPGETVRAGDVEAAVREAVPAGHKLALQRIEAGEDVIKYGYPIGRAVQVIEAGEHVHTHNLKTNLEGLLEYAYHPRAAEEQRLEGPALNRRAAAQTEATFEGYRRSDGRAGIRNEIWIIPTVGCVGHTAQLLAAEGERRFKGRVDGIHAFLHPMGCSQLAEDHLRTQKILAGLAHHPNAGGVLVVSLGCENNNLEVFRPFLEDIDERRIRYLVTQNAEDEIEEGMKLLDELTAAAAADRREPVPVSALTIGFKCGGSDGFSGITANPLCGSISDWICSQGGRAILTEVPEMFGAEQILMDRACSEEVFRQSVDLINGFKSYFRRYGQEIYENPSPGNKAGGITTLEEKSLGCVQKGGRGPVCGVLDYGQAPARAGLHLLNGPGNDLVSCTDLTASGAQMVLFTTGRGNPFGAPAPTVKIASNGALARRKPGWIDFNAGQVIEGAAGFGGFDAAEQELRQLILDVASGRTFTKNEKNGYREIAVMKDGVIL